MKNPCIPLHKALTLSLGEINHAVLTKYQLGVLVYKLYAAGVYKKQQLCIRKDQPALGDFSRSLKRLIDAGILSESRKFPSRAVFVILGKEKATSMELLCTVDPFSYVSHFSAMEFHGLTDRFPKIVYLSSPSSKNWSVYARQKMDKDLGIDLENYTNLGFPVLSRISLNRFRQVHLHSSNHLGAFKTVKGGTVRVSTIGRTFLDMLRQPDLCGGIRHVMDIYKNNAEIYLPLITAEIDRHGKPIDKVRAGYLLEEACGIDNDVIDGWQKFAARGGSRKLNPAAEYSPHYSERWCLSLNLEEA